MDSSQNQPQPQNHQSSLPELPKRNGLATASLILGIASVVGSCVTGIAAIICGHLARKQIKASENSQSGRGFALTGLITGYFFTIVPTLVVVPGLVIPVILKSTQRAEEVVQLNETKQLMSALALYAADSGGTYPTKLEELIPRYIPDQATLDTYVLISNKSQRAVSLTYIPGLKHTSPPGFIILHTSEDLQGRFIIARVNGIVEFIPESQFDLLTQKQRL